MEIYSVKCGTFLIYFPALLGLDAESDIEETN